MASPPPTPGAAGPTPEQMQQMQAAIAAEAQKRGITVEEFQAQQKAALEAEAQQHGMSLEQYINKLRKEAFENHQKQMQAQAQQQQQGQQVPIQNTGTPDPKAVALANWLRSQDLKVRTCILNGQRKDMFRGMLSPLLPPTYNLHRYFTYASMNVKKLKLILNHE